MYLITDALDHAPKRELDKCFAHAMYVTETTLFFAHPASIKCFSKRSQNWDLLELFMIRSELFSNKYDQITTQKMESIPK